MSAMLQGQKKEGWDMKRVIVLLGVTCLMTACAGERSPMVQSVQKKDKELSCTEVLLEMNEAEFYKNTAETKRQPSLKNVVMPLGYVSTYMNSSDAINAAGSRISYLNKIYEIMGCDGEKGRSYSDTRDINQRLARVEPAAKPIPYVQNTTPRKSGLYAPGTYEQADPNVDMERYMASAPYSDGYTPIRQRYESRRSNMGYDGYSNVPSYEESIPEGAPVESGY